MRDKGPDEQIEHPRHGVEGEQHVLAKNHTRDHHLVALLWTHVRGTVVWRSEQEIDSSLLLTLESRPSVNMLCILDGKTQQEISLGVFCTTMNHIAKGTSFVLRLMDGTTIAHGNVT